MNITFFLAGRYMRPRNAGQLLAFASWVAFGSVALGSIALVLALAILGGFERELRENAVKFTAHIEIQGFGKKNLPDYPTVLTTLSERVPNIRRVSAFLAVEGIARSSTFMDGVLIKGIVPETDVTSIRTNIVEGRFQFSAPDVHEVIIGGKLARKLGLSLGKKLTMYGVPAHDDEQKTSTSVQNFTQNLTQNLTAATFVEQCTIVGIYETGMSEYDDLYVYIPFQTAATVFQMPTNAASGFDVLVHDITKVQQTSADIESLLGYPFFPMTVFERYSDMFAWIELQKEPVPIVLGLITIVAVFNVVATLFMAVVQKMPSIGVLRALGMCQKDIRRVFVLQGMALGTAGTLTGCLIGFLLCLVQARYKVIALKGSVYFLSTVPIEFAVWHYGIVIGVSVVCSVLAALIPASVGAKIAPLKALQFQ